MSADVIAPVNKIINFSSVDGPGNRTSVFLQNCPFECKYCHNPETIHACVNCGKCVNACPAGALSISDGKVTYDIAKCCFCDTCIRTCEHMSSPRIRMMSAEEVMREIRGNMPFIRGVTVSGGECTQHRDFCLELGKLVKAEGLNYLLDSNGSLDFARDHELTEVIDGVMLDVKTWDLRRHIELTGMSNQTVLHDLCFLAEIGKLEEVRTVVVPAAMDPVMTVENVCRTLVRKKAKNTRYKIIKYRPMGVREPYRSQFESPDDALLAELAERAHSIGIMNTVIL